VAKITKEPFLAIGEIAHHRFFPKVNKFIYKSVYLSFPISQISKLKKLFFSLGKFNLYSFDDEKKFSWVKKRLADNGVKNVSEISVIAHPKILGFVFNPVCFWLCFNERKQLIAVLSEVQNTAKQIHSYLCFNEGLKPIGKDDWLKANKEFYVSPFMKIEGEYRFRFDLEKDAKIYINYLVEGKLKLSTHLKCSFRSLTNVNLILLFLRIPFATLKTIILIHYQALKLYFKKINFYKYPKPLKNDLTICKNEK
jgi:DUF1365 family protein